MYRICYKDRVSPPKVLFQKAKALTLDGWISYLDFFLGKNILDFNKPMDLAGKINLVHFTQQMERRNTRSMANGLIQYHEFNTSSYTPRWNTFIPRFTRFYNSVPPQLRQTSLRMGKWFEIKEMKENIKYFIRTQQKY